MDTNFVGRIFTRFVIFMVSFFATFLLCGVAWWVAGNPFQPSDAPQLALTICAVSGLFFTLFTKIPD
jgi:hypothetical protein